MAEYPLKIGLHKRGETCLISIHLDDGNEEQAIGVREKDDNLTFQLLELIGQQLNGEVITETEKGIHITLKFNLDKDSSGSTAAIPV